MWAQKIINIEAKSRGFHLITDEIIDQLAELKTIEIGCLSLMLQHTSAGLTINENADATVRTDFENFIDRLVPENLPYFKHTYEGVDDMPAHIKSSLIGVSLSIPITDGKLNLGTWQGIYLGEFRNQGGRRKILATLNGQVY